MIKWLRQKLNKTKNKDKKKEQNPPQYDKHTEYGIAGDDDPYLTEVVRAAFNSKSGMVMRELDKDGNINIKEINHDSRSVHK